MRRHAERIDRATPPTRDRALDGIRGVAVVGVVLGHWMVTGFVLVPGGGLAPASPLAAMPWAAPATWLLDTLALFFFVGGCAAALALRRARERGEGCARWMRSRSVRLARPVLVVGAVWGAVLSAGPALGAPVETMLTGALLTLQPLWFVAVYAAATALTPAALAADRRWGTAAALVPLAAVAAVDLARYGPWASALPDWVGYANVLPVWLFAYQLGVSWAGGRLRRPLGLLLLLGGVLGLAALVRAGYPVSAVGVPGAERSNSAPPSLLLPALAAAQIGAAVLLRAPLERLLRRPVPWAWVAGLNLCALTVFCWHLTALLAVGAAGAAWGTVPGLTDVPVGPAWLAWRLAWLVPAAAVLCAAVAAFRHFEGPWSDTLLRRPAARTAVALAAAAFAVQALALL
ncbi:membrane protein [Streptomonospora alba]|uniref:Membrane protein n=1 Tax=Streptomonospora alba TaxID=183763 RepID=A0A0C2JHL8_9ACTN|nr:acyltransferase family protein [Streptomonospora alba]KIH96482.1 membrane protein [Streptomonospora alba]